MIQRFSVNPKQVRGFSTVTGNFSEQLTKFPLLSLDTDTYVVGLEIQSGINFDVAGGVHCIAMGKYCSLAESITFMINLNHNYRAVLQGEPAFLKQVQPPAVSIPKKGSILLQNDVWIGHGALVMSGVTLHNGCVVAANAVVTKDVPPYAMVGGNPAKILGYRFDGETIGNLLRIAWWDWPEPILEKRQHDFLLPVSSFVEKHLPEAEERLAQVQPYMDGGGRKIVLFIPDVSESYPLYPHVFEEYFGIDRPETELLIYLPQEEEGHLAKIEALLQQYQDCNCFVTMQSGTTLDEHTLFACASYFVTTRSQKTIYRTCLADLYQTKILYGTDRPIFGALSQ